MSMPVKYVAILTLTLMIVAGLAALTYDFFTDKGEQVTGPGKKAGDKLDCVLKNKKNTDKCRDETAVEVRGPEPVET